MAQLWNNFLQSLKDFSSGLLEKAINKKTCDASPSHQPRSW
jgi:hypothetical protein